MKPKKKKDKKISYHRQPTDISLAEWQAGLRKQYGKDCNFTMTNLSEHPVYSDWQVVNLLIGNLTK